MNASRFSLLVLLALSGLILTTEAQSFDCAKAATPEEMAICSDSDLAAQDSEMTAVYKLALGQVSDEGKRWLTQSQRSWLNHKRNRVHPDVKTLKEVYRYRIDHLRRTLETVGPFKIEWISMFDSIPPEEQQEDAADEDLTNPYGTVDYTFPRIEAPVSPETSRWNRMVENRVHTSVGEPSKDVYSSAEAHITYAAKTGISIFVDGSEMDRGAAHPNHGGEGYTVLLASGKEMTATDLFNPQSAWKNFLKRKTKAEAVQREWQSYDGASGIEADSSRWTLTKKGLVIHFAPYEVTYYAAGPQEVLIPWPELKPYLNPTLPFSVPVQ